MKVKAIEKRNIEVELSKLEVIRIVKESLHTLLGTSGAEGCHVRGGNLIAHYRDMTGIDEHRVREATEVDEYIVATIGELYRLNTLLG